ncbi:MAG: saccharopine dehydrogenase NADP-binding domain-containing protein [Anaerolineales bacterium]|nr:saccharopine dehydrogenase NADP-binding domain-containing protein [Anaerolineales bacterium]
MITLFGATGYTGRRVAHALAQTGQTFRIAGRSPEKLAALAGQFTPPPPIVVASAQAPEPLFTPRRMSPTGRLAGPPLLINCAGPFTDLGLPVAQAAALHGSRYLDVSNELGFVFRLRQFDALARTTGAALVPAGGFEVAIADALVSALTRAVGALERVDVVYALPAEAISYGTRLAGLRTYATSWWTYRGGRWVGRLPGGEVRAGDFAGRPYRAISFPSAETVTVPAHSTVRDVQAWLALAPRWARPVAALMPFIDVLLRTPLGALTALSFRYLAPPPPEALLKSARFVVQIEAHRGAQRWVRTARGRDPYALTAAIVAYAAPRLLAAEFSRRGVLAPALAFADDEFLAWLTTQGVTVTAG